jgi:hypothetical protein
MNAHIAKHMMLAPFKVAQNQYRFALDVCQCVLLIFANASGCEVIVIHFGSGSIGCMVHIFQCVTDGYSALICW